MMARSNTENTADSATLEQFKSLEKGKHNDKYKLIMLIIYVLPHMRILAHTRTDGTTFCPI